MPPERINYRLSQPTVSGEVPWISSEQKMMKLGRRLLTSTRTRALGTRAQLSWFWGSNSRFRRGKLAPQTQKTRLWVRAARGGKRGVWAEFRGEKRPARRTLLPSPPRPTGAGRCQELQISCTKQGTSTGRGEQQRLGGRLKIKEKLFQWVGFFVTLAGFLGGFF